MRTIAIVFGDNDFSKTIHSIVVSLYNVLQYRKDLSENAVKEIVRVGIPFHYLAYQHSWDNPSGYDVGGSIHYLENRIKVLFDGEAERHISEHDHDGGSWYIELQSGNISSY
ncbi:MAG: hypothetical protein WC511_02170 [Candidatus Pacearchaeota archaeon]